MSLSELPESQQHFTYLTSEMNLDLKGLKIYEEHCNEIRTHEPIRDLQRRNNLYKKGFVEVGNACNQNLTYSWKVI